MTALLVLAAGVVSIQWARGHIAPEHAIVALLFLLALIVGTALSS